MQEKQTWKKKKTLVKQIFRFLRSAINEGVLEMIRRWYFIDDGTLHVMEHMRDKLSHCFLVLQNLDY